MEIIFVLFVGNYLFDIIGFFLFWGEDNVMILGVDVKVDGYRVVVFIGNEGYLFNNFGNISKVVVGG